MELYSLEKEVAGDGVIVGPETERFEDVDGEGREVAVLDPEIDRVDKGGERRLGLRGVALPTERLE